jgi:hypothetical protein
MARVSDFVITHWKKIVGIVMGFLTCVALPIALYFTFSGDEEVPELVLSQTGYYENTAIKPKRKLVRLVQPQIGDPQLTDQIPSIINHYTYFTCVANAPDGAITSDGKILWVGGGVGITQLHAMHPMMIAVDGKQIDSALVSLILKRSGSEIQIPLSAVKYKLWKSDNEEYDMISLWFPQRYVQRYSSIKHLFITDSEIDERLVGNVVRVKPQKDCRSYSIEAVGSGKIVTTDEQEFYAEVPEVDTKFRTTDSVVYESRSAPGDCNDVYAIDNVKSKRKFAALHVATVGGRRAIGVIVTQERLEKYAYSLAPEIEVQRGPLLDIGHTNERIEAQAIIHVEKYVPGNALEVMQLPEKHRRLFNFPPTETSYEPTGMFPDEPRIRGPAQLRKTGDNDPLLNALTKFDAPRPAFTPTLEYATVKKASTNNIITIMSKENLPGVISLNDAINTHINHEATVNSRISTSAGFGKFVDGKKELIESSGDDLKPWVAKPKLVESMNVLMSYVEQGIAPVLPHMLTLKDELRVESKRHKPRIFSACSFFLNLLILMYFGSAIDIYLKHQLEFTHAIGVNIQGAFGQMLAKQLTGNCVGYDISNNDNTIAREDIVDLYEALKSGSPMLDTRELQNSNHPDPVTELRRRARVRTVIIEMIATQHYILYDKVFTREYANPSGIIVTTVSNTETDMNQFRTNVLCLMKEKNHPMYKDIINVPMLVYKIPGFGFGDDVIAPEMVGATFEDYARVGKNQGRVYTLPDKDRSNEGGDPMKVFLSRRPRRINGVYHWCLPEDTIRSIVHYRQKSVFPPSEMNRIQCDAALAEWFHYGQARFNAEKRRYDAELIRLGCPPTILTYAKAMDDFIHGLSV